MRNPSRFEACRPAIAALAVLGIAVAGDALADGSVGVGVGTDKSHRLSITGDAANNAIEIRYGTDAQGNDVLVIEGKNGTTVRGEAKLEIPLGDGDITEIWVGAGLGDDNVTIDLSGLPEGKRMKEIRVAEKSGEGGDGGNDTTTLKNIQLAPKGKLVVKPGSDDDTTTVEGCDADNLTVEERWGDATVTVRDCNLNLLNLKLGDGDNTVRVEDSFYQQSTIDNKGAGVQKSLDARIERTSGKKTSLRGTPGDDNVVFEDSTLESVALLAGDGADFVSFHDTTSDKLRLDGGAGDWDCFSDLGGNDFPASYRLKGFEPESCPGAGELEYFGLGSSPFASPPVDAVAWRVRNPDSGHTDGPFALEGAANPLGLPVLDPPDIAPPAHWGMGPECTLGMTQLHHVHDAFEGHGDPASATCGHGVLEWARFEPVL